MLFTPLPAGILAGRTDLYPFVRRRAASAYKTRPADGNNCRIMELEASDHDPQALAAQAAEWRRRALRGERQARGIAHALEVKVRQLQGRRAQPDDLELDTRPLAPWEPPRRWWRPWGRG